MHKILKISPFFFSNSCLEKNCYEIVLRQVESIFILIIFHQMTVHTWIL